MVTFIVKVIVTLFLFLVAAIITGFWLLFGTVYLVLMLTRIIIIYTIALINSFISGTVLKEDYNKAIEEIVNTYVFNYVKICSLPIMIWHNQLTPSNQGLKQILSIELLEIKKSWFITTTVFVSFMLSFGLCLSCLLYANNKEMIDAYLEGKIISSNIEMQRRSNQ
ncbi:hypothetical protein [Seonamhaeicola sp.]|uniref:hypothetical protein n=1 Tax=Seonamhaeicola sp. TaxID=1912245 RepID=UPI00260F27F4|nr:hypothetical protein [Seonamhaeicola sp.]